MAHNHIPELSRGAGTPLFGRDVEKLDCQDDNAAVRQFSAEVLKHLADHHPNYIGEIVYLSVFGELIDACQNRSMLRIECVELILRARYFLDPWQLYLKARNYPHDQYFLSCKAESTFSAVIEGFLALVIIHRDELNREFPLLP